MRKLIRTKLQEMGDWSPTTGVFGLSAANGVLSSVTGLSESLNKVSSFAQQGEDLIIQRIFARRLGIDPRNYRGFYVDVGAYHPISHSTTYLFYRLGWSGVCVDISDKTCELIRKFRPRDQTFHCAVASADQKLAFVSAPGISLINEAQKQDQSQAGNEQRIDARSINSLLAEAGRADRIDYLNIDVEGAELEALAGLDFDRWAPRVITIEIHEKSLEAGLAHPISRYLVEKGYVCLACAAITYVFVRADDLK